MSKTWKEEPRATRVYETREHAINEVRDAEAQQEIFEALREVECEEIYVQN